MNSQDAPAMSVAELIGVSSHLLQTLLLICSSYISGRSRTDSTLDTSAEQNNNFAPAMAVT
jgi:hypothetical protein